jgi:predicted RNase H-like nuclease (RuvC/YqgF family)
VLPPLRFSLALAALTLSGLATADDLRVRQLESDVARLQRELAAQARRIDQLERDLRNAGEPGTRSGAPLASATPKRWLVAANWELVKPQMKESEVLALLGPPTSVRVEDDGSTRVLLYALELDAFAVLAGNVRLDARGVRQINKPGLR